MIQGNVAALGRGINAGEREALKGYLGRERGQMPSRISSAPWPCRTPQDKVRMAGFQTPYKQTWRSIQDLTRTQEGRGVGQM